MINRVNIAPPPRLSNHNKYVHNKDDFTFILNDVSTSTTSSSDVRVNSNLNKIIISIIILLNIFIIFRLVMMSFRSRGNIRRISYLFIAFLYIYYIHKYYIIIAFKISEFIETNLLFNL